MSRAEGRPGPWLLLAGAVALAFFLLPLLGLVARSPWTATAELVGSPAVRSALWLSLLVATSATAAALAFGFPLAWLLARTAFPGRALVRTLVMIPMVLPPVVGGVALLAAFGRRGLLGQALTPLGISLPFSTLAAVLAACFVAAPFLVTTLEAGLAQLDRRHEQVAATLGASRLRILWTVVLPALRPSLAAGLALCWARALGEFGATITFAGNLPGRTQTLTLAIYETLQTRPADAFLLGCLLLGVSVLVLGPVRGWRRLG
jgi:molybdate transport system permease protein